MQPLRLAPLVAGLLVALPSTSRADVELPSVFGNHMVVQRDQAIPVWGRASAGEAVTVTFGNSQVQTTADAEGHWRVDLPAQPASDQPQILSVQGDNTVSFQDVMVGEVWVCSGQSNMEWSIAASMNPQEEIAGATESRIRMIKATRTLANTPQFTVAGEWKVSSPETAAQFSAVAFYFGRHLFGELGVPIGLINTSWGGSRAEPWTSHEAMLGHTTFAGRVREQDQAIAAFRNMDANDIERAYQEQVAAFSDKAAAYWKRAAAEDPGQAGGWMKADLDTSGWDTTQAPGLWRDVNQALAGFDGMVWYRKEIEIPVPWDGKDLVLELGMIDDADVTYFNGVQVGNTIQQHRASRRYTVPGKLVKAGAAVITVMALDTGGAGGMTGPRDQMRLSRGDPSEPSVTLAGDWLMRQGGDNRNAGNWPSPPARPSEPGVSFTSPCAMYNAMIHPFVPYGMRGAIWYQGESNSGQAEEYRELLPLMIQSWRDAWGHEFPFGIVQLASFYPAALDEPVQGGWAFLREAQWMTDRNVPNTGLAIAPDIGNARDIHPKNKQEVGRRLGLWAMATVYGQDVVYSGPAYRRASLGGPNAVLEFDHVGGGLVARDGELKGFAVAGEDGEFVWGQARIDGDTVVVSAPGIDKVTAVRYGWCNNLEHLNLYNEAGLPASPFRTDHP